MAIDKLPERVDILRMREERRRLLVPVEIDGRRFTEEFVPRFAPYIRKQAADVEEREGGIVVSIRELRDVSVGMGVAWKGDAYAIVGVGELQQTSRDAEDKEIQIKFTQLHCKPVEG